MNHTNKDSTNKLTTIPAKKDANAKYYRTRIKNGEKEVALTISPELHTRLKEVARKYDFPVTRIIRDIIHYGIINKFSPKKAIKETEEKGVLVTMFVKANIIDQIKQIAIENDMPFRKYMSKLIKHALDKKIIEKNYFRDFC